MAKIADICLVVEGSYPYVTGGVAAWLQWLMQAMAPLTFAVTALIAEPKTESQRKYRLPANVVDYREFVVFDFSAIDDSLAPGPGRRQWRRLAPRLHLLMHDWRRGQLCDASLVFLKELITAPTAGIFRAFLSDENAFTVLTQIYEKVRGDAGFTKYFYNFRNIHLILFRLLTLVSHLPEAAVYHSPGTGYAGLLACLRAVLFGGRSIITEHGIYLQEREMDLLRSNWLDTPYLKDMWIDAFSAVCRWQYSCCNRLITLYQGNRQLQAEYGAVPQQVLVVPNGIDTARFAGVRRPRCAQALRRIGLVGRVDAVKDIKTFIQAIAMLRQAYPAIAALVIGPTEDQPDYHEQCLQLRRMLGLDEVLTFTGRANVLDYYSNLDLLVLTSIKEAMPLVVMEAMASGIPVVATDVGACRELLYGLQDGLGQAGLIARVMDPDSVAEAALKIIKDPTRANAMARSGMARIEAFYREQIVIDAYRRIYREQLDGRLNGSAAAPPPTTRP
jgi:glycosyltransferase involved in cell wall biosynthesis